MSSLRQALRESKPSILSLSMLVRLERMNEASYEYDRERKYTRLPTPSETRWLGQQHTPTSCLAPPSDLAPGTISCLR
nr:hypothetical protein Q903MT_gene4538 [Picea sitchensis]